MRETPTERETAMSCRRCSEPVPQDQPFGPFCSSRCQMADLGAWFDGSYKISREIKDTDLTDPE